MRPARRHRDAENPRLGNAGGTGAVELELGFRHNQNQPARVGRPWRDCMHKWRAAANPPKILATVSPNCADSSQKTDGQFINVAGSVALTGNEGTVSTSTSTVTKEAAIRSQFLRKWTFPCWSSLQTRSHFRPRLRTPSPKRRPRAQIHSKVGHLRLTRLRARRVIWNIRPRAVLYRELVFVASGWAWWTYKSKVNDHWNWALLMEAYLTNEADRTSNMEIKVDMSSNTNSNYSAICTGGSGTPAATPTHK